MGAQLDCDTRKNILINHSAVLPNEMCMPEEKNFTITVMSIKLKEPIAMS